MAADQTPTPTNSKYTHRWYHLSKNTLTVLLTLLMLLGVVFALWEFREYKHRERLDAFRAIHKIGGVTHRDSIYKDEVEGEFLEIDFRKGHVTDADLDYIITLNPKDRILLGSNSSVSESGIKKLQKALPNCTIER
jgi:hypothetical protein